MWRLWVIDSQEEQQWDNSNDASEGIPVLASDSDDSVIFVAEKAFTIHTASPHFSRAAIHTLPTFSSSASDTSSPLGEY